MEVLKASSLTTADILIDHLVANPDNINEMKEETLQKLVEEIREVGFIAPIQVIPLSDGRYLVLGGHHRLEAAKRAGLTYITSVILTDAKWNDEDLRDLVSFKLNVIRGSQNPEKFIKLYERMAPKFGHEKLQDVFAITDKMEWKKLTKSIKKDLKASGVPEELVDQVSQAEAKAKDFNQFTKSLNKIFKNHANTVAHGCVVFMNGNNEHIMIQASDKTFEAIKAVSSLASSQSRNVNEYLEPVLLGLLSGGESWRNPTT